MPSITSILTTIVALSSSVLAYTTPTTYNVSTNAIFTPSLGQLVPVGKAFQVTWGNNTSGTVSIVLLRGPEKNILPLYAIAEKIPNTGSFSWTPKTDLEPDTTHYGLQLIQDSTGQYQYSVQFGISNPNYSSSSSATATATKTTSSAATGYTSSETTSTSYATVSHTVHSSVTSYLTLTTSSVSVSTSAPTTLKTTSTTIAPTYGSGTNTTVPTGTSLPSATPTGSASGLKVGSALLMSVAAIAAFLL